MTEPFIPEFSSREEREKWFVENADYFTIVRRAKGKSYRVETKTLVRAETLAKSIVEQPRYQHVRLLIYAVRGVSDTYVETIAREGIVRSKDGRPNPPLQRKRRPPPR